MALRVLRSPGCSRILRKREIGIRPGEILIDTGDIASSLGFDPTSPNANRDLLRVAGRLRGLAITAANEAGLSGVVRTSNPRSVPKLLEQTGAESATVIHLSRAEACRRIRALYPDDRDRQILCELGLDRYYQNVERTT